MASTYKNMTLRERVPDDERKKQQEENEVRILEACEISDEEVVKKRRKDRRRLKYDSQGVHVATRENMCDCLRLLCPGCHFPCPKCSSLKCGHECRKSRKWEYEQVEIEGTSIIIKNPLKK